VAAAASGRGARSCRPGAPTPPWNPSRTLFLRTMGNMGKRQRAICMSGGFLEGMALCRYQVLEASFFLGETRFFGVLMGGGW